MPRKLKNWLQAYISYMEYSEAPAHFHFWAGVSAIAGALRRKVYMDQIYFRWLPNFYIIFVAPSGVATKSTAIGAAMDILKDLPDISFGPNAMTWQALVPALTNAQIDWRMPSGDYEAMSCLTFSASELGVLINFTEREMLNVLTDLWDGKMEAWKKATVGRGEDNVNNPWINIIAGTTPAWIADNMGKHVIGGGFSSRCVFVYGDKKRRLSAYPKKEAEARNADNTLKLLKESLTHDLDIISNLAGEYYLTPDAEAFGEKWYVELHTNPDPELVANQFDGYLSRKQGHVHKVAMVISAAQRDSLEITIEDLNAAIALTDSIEADMPKVFRYIRQDAGGIRIDEVIQILQVQKTISRMTLFRMCFQRFSMQKIEFDTIVDSAIAAGFVTQGAEFMLTYTGPTGEKEK